MMKNRRFRRVPFQADTLIIFGEKKSSVTLQDISLKGALILSQSPLQLTHGEPCQLNMRLHQSEIELAMEAKVAYQKDNWVGLEFSGIELDSLTHLRSLVACNINDEESLENDLALWFKEGSH